MAMSGGRDDGEVRDGRKIWDVPARWSGTVFRVALACSSWEPRLVLRAK